MSGEQIQQKLAYIVYNDFLTGTGHNEDNEASAFLYEYSGRVRAEYQKDDYNYLNKDTGYTIGAWNLLCKNLEVEQCDENLGNCLKIVNQFLGGSGHSARVALMIRSMPYYVFSKNIGDFVNMILDEHPELRKEYWSRQHEEDFKLMEYWYNGLATILDKNKKDN